MAIAAPFPAARATRTPSRPVRSRAAAPTRSARPPARPAACASPAAGRVALGVLSTLFLLLVVLFSGRLSADAGTSMSDQGRATGVVVVQAGESLWQIAQAIAPQADPRETVTLIRELNGLGEAAVVPGSVDRRAGHRGTGRLTRGPSVPSTAVGPRILDPCSSARGSARDVCAGSAWSAGAGLLALAVSVPGRRACR